MHCCTSPSLISLRSLSNVCLWLLCRHDFTICETIEFEEGEDEDLPPPLTLKDIIALNKAKDYADEVAAAAEAAAEAEAASGGAKAQVGDRAENQQL